VTPTRSRVGVHLSGLRRLRCKARGMALDLSCPGCGTQMYAEQAHNRCPVCRYYEPCCDGAPLACATPSGSGRAAASQAATSSSTPSDPA
jgi:hypothetical protein